MKQTTDKPPSFMAGLKPLRDDFKPLSCFAAAEPLADKTLDIKAGLKCDQKYVSRARRRQMKDLRQVSAAQEHLERLPEAGEAFHCVIGGQYPLWSLVPALAALVRPGRSEEAHIVTLSFSHQNAIALPAKLDAGEIGKVTFLVSHYFRATSAEVYAPLEIGLRDRGHRLLAMRTHAKVILFALSDGRRIVVESSANLRSGANIETFMMANDADLYQFHKLWIEELFT